MLTHVYDGRNTRFEVRSGLTLLVTGALLSVVLFSGCASTSGTSPETQFTQTESSIRRDTQVDDYLFPQLNWGQDRSEVADVLGEPISTDGSTPDSISLWYESTEIFGYVAVVAAGLDPNTEELHSVQAFLVYQREDPNVYVEDYGKVEERLDGLYGKSTQFDWYSPKAEPSFTGMEIFRQELAFISHRILERSILVHSMMFSEGHINHTVGFYDSTAQDIETTLEIFAASYAASLR